jgi:hypothetical protein
MEEVGEDFSGSQPEIAAVVPDGKNLNFAGTYGNK